jgi:hypothetical protein
MVFCKWFCCCHEMYPDAFPRVSGSRGSAAQIVDGNLKDAGPRFRSRAPPVLGANLVAHNTVLPTLRVTCVSVSEVPVFIYLLRPSQPVSSFLEYVSQTAWQHCDPCFWHGQLYVACLRVRNPTNIYILPPEGKKKNFSDISNRR